MPYKDRTKKIKKTPAKLTLAQRKEITALYSQEASMADAIGVIATQFGEGENVAPMVREAYRFSKSLEAVCENIMLNTPQPKTKDDLKKALHEKFPDDNASFFGDVVNKVVEATGTWSDYKDSFNLNV